MDRGDSWVECKGVERSTHIGDDAVKDAVFEPELPRGRALLACAQAPKVFRRAGYNISAEGHLDPARRPTANRDVEINNRIGSHITPAK